MYHAMSLGSYPPSVRLGKWAEATFRRDAGPGGVHVSSLPACHTQKDVPTLRLLRVMRLILRVSYCAGREFHGG